MTAWEQEEKETTNSASKQPVVCTYKKKRYLRKFRVHDDLKSNQTGSSLIIKSEITISLFFIILDDYIGGSDCTTIDEYGDPYCYVSK